MQAMQAAVGKAEVIRVNKWYLNVIDCKLQQDCQLLAELPRDSSIEIVSTRPCLLTCRVSEPIQVANERDSVHRSHVLNC
jgi:hypothetical protein